jgi:hypothetical protein
MRNGRWAISCPAFAHDFITEKRSAVEAALVSEIVAAG